MQLAIIDTISGTITLKEIPDDMTAEDIEAEFDITADEMYMTAENITIDDYR